MRGICGNKTIERAEMGQRDKEYVEKHHAIPVLADKLERVLKEVVQNS